MENLLKNILEFFLNHSFITFILLVTFISVSGFIKYKNPIVHSYSVDYSSHGLHESKVHLNWNYSFGIIIDILAFILANLLAFYSITSSKPLLFTLLSIFIIIFIIVFVNTAGNSTYSP